MNDALRQRLEAEGAVWAQVAGRSVARHFGDGAAEYRAVRESAGVALRSDLAVFRMWGRDPVKMLNGLITNDLGGAGAGQGVYAAMLTPKGRTVADLRAFRLDRESGPEILVVAAAEAAAGTREHFRKYVPPLFSRWEDAFDRLGVLGLYCRGAAALVRRVLGEIPAEPGEDRFADVLFQEEPVVVVRTLEVGLEEGFDLIASESLLAALRDAFRAEGAHPVGFGTLETLRVEAGRPRYGSELTEETIPTEAYEETGLLSRAISFTKGCYTGQEVIVRIAHRGHVNRHLRGLLLGDSPAPAPRTPLFHPETGKEIGWTTSAAHSPLVGQTVALAFVRREVGPGGEVRLGAVDGPSIPVVELPFAPA
jgi:folate-binding protein YgfZ